MKTVKLILCLAMLITPERSLEEIACLYQHDQKFMNLRDYAKWAGQYQSFDDTAKTKWYWDFGWSLRTVIEYRDVTIIEHYTDGELIGRDATVVSRMELGDKVRPFAERQFYVPRIEPEPADPNEATNNIHAIILADPNNPNNAMLKAMINFLKAEK